MTRVLSCAQCGAPTTFLAARCAYCDAPLAWHDVPTLAKGSLLSSVDFTRGQTLPHMDRIGGIEMMPGRGALVRVAAGNHQLIRAHEQRRNAALLLAARTQSEGATFGLEFRLTLLGRARTAYLVELVPSLRAYKVERVLGGVGELSIETLRSLETVSAVRPAGELNVLEVRYADSILSVRVNDVPLGSFVDARYGFGGFGATVGAGHAAPGAVLLERFEVYEVG